MINLTIKAPAELVKNDIDFPIPGIGFDEALSGIDLIIVPWRQYKYKGDLIY